MQSELAKSQIDPKRVHDKFWCSKLHFNLLIVFVSFESYMEYREY